VKYVGKLYGYVVYFTAISCILWPFGIFCGHLGIPIFLVFGMLHQEQSGNPGSVADRSSRAQANFGGILSPATLAV
jgi:hypothetical protein